MSNKKLKRMANSGGPGEDLRTWSRKTALERIELRQQELLMKLDAVEKAVKSQKYATPQFSNTVLEQMYQFYKEGQFCDFQVKVQEQVFKVHRLVMASSSDYFQAMLSHDMVETRQESTDLLGMNLRGVEPLIEYAYTGKLDLTMDMIHDVISAATFLQMSSAIELCISFLKENMSFENAEELLKIGDLFSIPSLKEYYRNYLLKNFLKFVESDSFLRIDADSLADYLSDDALMTTSECILFHHCLRWYKHSPKERDSEAAKVFEKIRMCSDGWPLIHFASQHEPFLSNKSCQDLITFSEKYLEDATKRYINNTSYRTRVRSTRQTIIQFGGVMETNEEYDSFHDMLSLPSNEPCGWNMNHFFHPDLKCWFPLGIVGQWMTRLSHQRFVEVNGCGVMIGGYEYMVNDDMVDKICIRDVKMFTAQGSFQVWDMPSLKHERAHHAAVFLDGYIYAIAGKDDRQTLSSVECLDCDKETWSYAKPLPRKLYDHAAAVCDGKIFVSGGAEFSRVKKHVWCYDPQRNNWNKKQDLNCGRAGHGMVCFQGQLYVAGGYNGSIEALNPDALLRCLLSVEQYCPVSNQWTKLHGMKHCLTFFEMTVMDGKIVVMGGLDSSGRLTQYMHEYDHEFDRWRIFGELPRPLKNAGCGVVTVKLTDTGCMENETDDMVTEYEDLFEEYEREQNVNASARMMENFGPGDYDLSDEGSCC